MDFRHLIVTCLFSKLRLPFDNQKVKENYAILIYKLFDFSTKPKSFLFKDIIFLGKCVHQSEIFHLSMLFSKSNLQLDQTKMDD